MTTSKWLANLVAALEEDAIFSDITSPYFFSESGLASAVLMCKEDGFFFGKDIGSALMTWSDGRLNVTHTVSDGDAISAGQVIATWSGNARLLIGIERVWLNLLQHLSGITTRTRAFVAALDQPAIHILDTRKTTPLWRDLEKAAVRAGGGYNHRRDLSDMILIKENHLAALGSGAATKIAPLLQQMKSQFTTYKIEIEIQTLAQAETWPLALADYVLLDNFQIQDVPKAVNALRQNGCQAEIEISGNIRLDTIHQYRDLPVHRISVGSLTHSVKALDLSLIFQ